MYEIPITHILPLVFILFALSLVSLIVYGDFISKFFIGVVTSILGICTVINVVLIGILFKRGEFYSDESD